MLESAKDLVDEILVVDSVQTGQGKSPSPMGQELCFMNGNRMDLRLSGRRNIVFTDESCGLMQMRLYLLNWRKISVKSGRMEQRTNISYGLARCSLG